MKRYIAFILAVLSLLAVFCGCDANEKISFIDLTTRRTTATSAEKDEYQGEFNDNNGFDESEAHEEETTQAASSTEKKTTTTTVTTSKTTSKTTAKTDGEPAEIVKPNRKTKYYIVVYTGSQSTVVYGKNSRGKYTEVIKVFTCSTGSKDKPTRTGQYKISKKYKWRLLVGNVYGQYSSSIGGNYLFHSVPYKKKSASTLDNEEYDKLGSPASHGCIRLCSRDSKWIYDNCAIGTQVNIVKSSGPAGPGVPKRKKDKKYDGWDPSDKWAKGNPYFSSSSDTTTASTTAETTKETNSTTTTTKESEPTAPSEEGGE